MGRLENNKNMASINPAVEPDSYTISNNHFYSIINKIKKRAIIMLDENGVIVVWNNAATTITGYNSQDVTGRHFSFICSPFQSAQTSQYLEMARTEGFFEHKAWFNRKDGHCYWAVYEIYPYINEQAKFSGFTCFLKDKTHKVNIEVEPGSMKQRLQLFIDCVKDYAIFMLDPNGIILTWNSGAHRIKGYSSEEIIGKHFSVFYSSKERDKDHPKNALLQAKNEGRFETDGWRYRKDGSRFWANVIITPFYNEEELLIGFGKVTRDLTEQRQKDLNLRKSLNRNVKLLAINQELEEYAFTVAHDIQAPIRGINHYIHILEDKIARTITPEIKEMLSAMKDLAKKSGNLLDSLLQIARVGNKDLFLENLDLNGLISDLVTFLQNSFASENIDISLSHQLPHIYCNKIRMRELFYNLIVNAIKYNDKNLKQSKLAI